MSNIVSAEVGVDLLSLVQEAVDGEHGIPILDRAIKPTRPLGLAGPRHVKGPSALGLSASLCLPPDRASP